MKLRLGLSVIAVLVSVALLFTLLSSAQTSGAASVSVPPVIQFSNLASDASGTPLSGTVSITFSLYNNSQGGQALWTRGTLSLPATGAATSYLTRALRLPA